MKNPPGLKIFDQPQQIPILSAKKITNKFFWKKIFIFNAALLHLKFYYISVGGRPYMISDGMGGGGVQPNLILYLRVH